MSISLLRFESNKTVNGRIKVSNGTWTREENRDTQTNKCQRNKLATFSKSLV